jgi:hypothetical protein
MVGIPLLLCTIAAIHQHSMWLAVAICFLGLGFVFVWLRAYQITVENGRLQYRSLWRGRQTVPLSDIQSAKIEIGNPNSGDAMKPPVRLVVQYVEAGKARHVCINLKVFSRSDVEEVLSLLKVT